MRARLVPDTWMSSKEWTPDKKHIPSTELFLRAHFWGNVTKERHQSEALSTALGGQITTPHFTGKGPGSAENGRGQPQPLGVRADILQSTQASSAMSSQKTNSLNFTICIKRISRR